MLQTTVQRTDLACTHVLSDPHILFFSLNVSYKTWQIEHTSLFLCLSQSPRKWKERHKKRLKFTRAELTRGEQTRASVVWEPESRWGILHPHVSDTPPRAQRGSGAGAGVKIGRLPLSLCPEREDLSLPLYTELRRFVAVSYPLDEKWLNVSGERAQPESRVPMFTIPHILP